jgi:hypothetical protein
MNIRGDIVKMARSLKSCVVKLPSGKSIQLMATLGSSAKSFVTLSLPP